MQTPALDAFDSDINALRTAAAAAPPNSDAMRLFFHLDGMINASNALSANNPPGPPDALSLGVSALEQALVQKLAPVRQQVGAPAAPAPSIPPDPAVVMAVLGQLPA